MAITAKAKPSKLLFVNFSPNETPRIKLKTTTVTLFKVKKTAVLLAYTSKAL